MKSCALEAPLAGALRDALLSHGWEGALAASTATGMDQVALHLEGLDPASLEPLVVSAGRLGLELITGDNWAVLAGSRSRLSVFASRPWTLPPELAAVALLVAQALPEPPEL